ncbi:MAG: hypothetical protein LBQ64_03545 [Bacteroidales bacterium]|jgi:hypothetical protein|nr:hypothetical protein [Bacteroidales bacterium]
MKKVYLIAAGIVLSSSVYAQKVEGSLDFLKEVEELNIQFEYKGMMIKKQTEQQYVAEQVKEKNKDQKGKGDEWKSAWETSDRDYIQEVFLKDFNAEVAGMGIDGGDYPNSLYTATVRTVWLDPGYMAGPMTKPSVVTVEIVFTKQGSNKPIAKVRISKAKGSLYDFGNTYGSDARRIGSSYGEAGEKLGKVTAKILQKKK